MCKMESTIGKSIDLEVTNDNFKYSMCKTNKTKQMVKLTQCVSLIEPIKDKTKQLYEYLNLLIHFTNSHFYSCFLAC